MGVQILSNGKRARLAKAALSVAMTLLFLVLAELGFRAVRYVVKGPDIELSETVDDPELGWCLNTQRDGFTKTNMCGEQVVTARHPHPLLVRFDDSTDGTRILFLGDSHTHAHEVSSGRAYYDIFDSVTDGRFAVFAAGIGGFGNLQEYLLLQSVWDEVRPEIVVWQLDQNDIANNVFELDSGSFFNNQRLRPYLDLESDRIEFRDPGFFLFDVSHLFRFLFHRTLALDWKHDLGLLESADRLIAPSAEQLPALTQQGLDVLRTVVERSVSGHPQTRFYGFSASEPCDFEFRRVFLESGAGYFADFAATVAASPVATDCRPLDAHWNHHGHDVAGRLLAHLIQEAVVQQPSPEHRILEDTAARQDQSVPASASFERHQAQQNEPGPLVTWRRL
jgi:hypothetical protein